MQVVFVIAPDWKLRIAVRAQLRESGVKALGMETPDEAGRAIAAGDMPSVVLLEGTPELASHPAIKSLVKNVPTILIASRTQKVDLPPVAALLYRPVRIAEIVNRIQELLQRPHQA